MSTPKGMKCQPRTLASGERVLLYTDASRIVLQLRRQVPTEEDLLSPSFKVAVSLSALEAAQLAGDLLGEALAQLHTREPATISSRAGQPEDEEL
jgi:hypothetical protein